MKPEELKANVARFNEGSGRAQDALGRLKTYQATNEIPAELVNVLNDYIAACSDMLEASSELIEPALRLSAG